ncbi:MAG TPA: HAMP domain-containing sensor histidine kinase [Gemmatimonadaceae bacterium]|jgi:signal transduction histidine kinase|nr:HAMP domain-containing sensor histidine kinase [Gemmatimonadaceae bacterium]
MSEESPPSNRLAPEWATWLALAFVVLSLAALIVVPYAISLHLDPYQSDLSESAEPARGQLTRIHLAMALQGSALDAYIDERDSIYLVRFDSAGRQEAEAYRRLTPLVERLGATPRARLAELLTLEDQWHRAVARYIRTTPELPRLGHDDTQEDLYDKTLVAAANLDEAITQVTRERRARITEGELLRQRTSALLGLLALLAAIAAWRLGRSARAAALDAERRRATLADVMASRARFMRGVSHDLKNPLHAIDGHAQLLESGLRGPLTLEQLDSLARIRRSVTSMTRLIEDLLELARAESGQLTMSLDSVVVHDLVHSVVEEHRAAAEAVGLRLAFAPAGSDVVVVTDPARVGQVLGNLLSNAIKYTPAGGNIQICAEPAARHVAEHDAPALAIHVVDDGPGIPQTKYEEIFGEFTRLQPDDKPGAGLGLSIARRIARMLGGDISVSGHGVRGSRFTLWLPLQTSSSPRAEESATTLVSVG